MRQQQKSNRSRGRGNRKGGGGGGGGGNNMNRVFDSTGPEGKVRGTPQQIIDKYLTLARDAQTSGDRVTGENFLQHAEHYQRILIAAMSEQEKARRDNAQQNADNQPDEAQPPSMQVAEQPRNNENKQPAEEPRGKAPAPEAIGGMTTIDSGGESDSLVVAPEEGAQKPPRSNGSGRRSRQRSPRADSEGTEKPASPPAEAAEATES